MFYPESDTSDQQVSAASAASSIRITESFWEASVQLIQSFEKIRFSPITSHEISPHPY